MSHEEKEGYEAYWNAQSLSANPYTWSNQTWWMVEAWEKGWKQAEGEDYDDD